jgi:CHASE2 domain-containing sensor protein
MGLVTLCVRRGRRLLSLLLPRADARALFQALTSGAATFWLFFMGLARFIETTAIKSPFIASNS